MELPAGEDLNEWLAVNTIEFYNEINVLYGILTEFCTPESCPTMSAGPKYEYLWADGQNVKTPLKVSAGEYIDFLMTWVESQLNNEKVFPCAMGVPFPRNFERSPAESPVHLGSVTGGMRDLLPTSWRSTGLV